MAASNVTGTCKNCMMRFRFDAREVVNLETIFCPHCGIELEGEKIKVFARQMLKNSLRPIPITKTCTKCGKRCLFDAREVVNLTDIFCQHCGVGLNIFEIRVLAQYLLDELYFTPPKIELFQIFETVM